VVKFDPIAEAVREKLGPNAASRGPWQIRESGSSELFLHLKIERKDRSAMGIKVGIVGLGQFAPSFVTLFAAHPSVSEVYLCETIPERLIRAPAGPKVTRKFASFAELLRSEVDAVAVFTQRWTHGPMAVEALSAGKHVYSAVPMGVSVEEVGAIVEVVARTGLTYMLGETSWYYPAVIFCRQRMQTGQFGSFVYGEGEYLHDMEHGFYDAYRYSGGDSWKATASFPPMFYPTHSSSGILSITGAHAVAVSCLGYVDHEDDGVFDAAISDWGNEFSNEIALFRTSDGGALRIAEMRRVGVPNVEPNVRFSLFGTKGSFEQQTGASVWATQDSFEDVTPLLQTHAHVGSNAVEDDDDLSQVPKELRWGFRSGFAAVHDRSELPTSFADLPNGHEGSHQFLVNDFIRACTHGMLPPINAWAAARFSLPGLIAHRSAQADGQLMPVPDFGEPPGYVMRAVS
jgi:predicted dehydrogenase